MFHIFSRVKRDPIKNGEAMIDDAFHSRPDRSQVLSTYDPLLFDVENKFFFLPETSQGFSFLSQIHLFYS